MARIAHLRVAQPACGSCAHALFGQHGVFCPIYNEYISNEYEAAKDCPMYESTDTRTEEAVIIGLTDRRKHDTT